MRLTRLPNRIDPIGYGVADGSEATLYDSAIPAPVIGSKTYSTDEAVPQLEGVAR